MKHIDKLLQESTLSNDSVVARPALLSLTRATTQLIYNDIVASQPTSQPIAALYGLKYLNPNGDLTFVTGSTYGGEVNAADRKNLKVFTGTTPFQLSKGELFLYSDVVFKALKDNPLDDTNETDAFLIISESISGNEIRIMSNAAETSKYENPNTEVSEASFEIRKWEAKVKSRKLKTELTIELAQDMESNGFDAPEMVEDLLATQMAEEINKDILQSLITVSQRFKVAGVSDKAVLDLSNTNLSSIEASRNLYRYVCEMNASIQRQSSYSATYAVASSRVAALLTASGFMQKKDDQPESAYGVLNNGLVLYSDNNTPADYIIVGVKAEYGETEMIGSLFYAPYTSGRDHTDPVDHVGAYKVINDPDSLQPHVALLVRYALCVNPYTMGLDANQLKTIDSTDLDSFAGQSKMSVLLGVKLPKLVD